MDLDFTEGEGALRQELRELLDELLPRHWAGVWNPPDGPEISERAVRELAQRGWLTRHWPDSYGGGDASVWEQVVIQEELFARHEPRGGQYMGVNWIGPTIMKFGNDRQRATYLPEIAAGAVQWAQLYSEPEAGSDLAHLRTVARERADGSFVVNGEKLWTSYANVASRGFLLARTDPTESGHRGISAFLISMDTPGITVREVPSAVGWHRFHGVSFVDVQIPPEALLGELHGGWRVAMESLPFERLGNARYARTTRVLGLIERLVSTASSVEDGVRRDLVDCLAMGRMAELMNYSAIAVNERGEDLSWHASAAFATNANYERAVGLLAERVLGSAVFVASPDDQAVWGGEVESFAVRQAPTVTVQAGTYQVQLGVIASRALDLPRAR